MEAAPGTRRLRDGARAPSLRRVDPDNRLVARTLERDWECALSAEQALRDEQQRALAEEPEHLTDADREAIRQLAQNIPALWSAASDRKSTRLNYRPQC